MKFFLFSLIAMLGYNSLFSQNCYDPGNVYSFVYKGINYEIIKENKTWVDAAECAYIMGGKLAEINSQEEQDTIFYHLSNAGIDPEMNIAPDGGNASYIWLGGTDIAEEGKWIWDGANTGVGNQFWEGLRTGNPVNGLFNNWGNEPDNFNNQDGLGLAITNWAFGIAGQWNDISQNNSLYFIIEYDHSTLKLNKVEYDYDLRSFFVYSDFNQSCDSLQISLNDSIISRFYNISESDSILSVSYFASSSQYITIRLFAFSGNTKSTSRKSTLNVFSIKNPDNSYYTDFEDIPSEDFLGEGFEIKKEFGFRNYAIHSNHNYETEKEYSYTLIKPIKINGNSPEMTYADVAIVEPGIEGSLFGESAFNDYVVVEGSRNLTDWIPLIEGYDARYYAEWETAWLEGGVFRNMYKTHSIDLTDTFEDGDTILIRFRMHSNSSVTGWGWTIDSLQIQETPLNYHSPLSINHSYRLHQNYPNPFNPVTSITFEIPRKEFVKLSVIDILGREIEVIVQAELAAGVHTYNFDASDYSSGTYIYRILAGEFSLEKKLILLK